MHKFSPPRPSITSTRVCTGRHEYTLFADTYFAEYSRYNHTTNSFDEPVDKMVYILNPMHQDNNPLS